MSELLGAEGLGRRLPDGSWGIAGVTLRIAAGDRILLTGPSGSGKTLLLRALALLDPLDAGEVRWRGRSIADREVPAFRGRVAYLHQSPSFVAGTVESNLRAPFELAVHASRRFDRARVCDLLARAGFDEALLQRRTGDLSGGERQILALVRLLQLEPRLLLLDEPTAALDPDAARRAAALVRDWAAEEVERAFVWVGHQARVADEMATRRMRCEEGALVEAK